MKEQLMKAMQRKQILGMMYLSNAGTITKRRIQIIKLKGELMTAYCFTRRAKRTFLINNILAVSPVVRKEKKEARKHELFSG